MLRARQQGVDIMAITDHDTIDGYLDICEHMADFSPMQLISGVELSCQWGGQTVHIVGLNIDPQCPELLQGVSYLQRARSQRAQLISDKLDRLGFSGAYDFVTRITKGSQIGRPHFARFLVEHNIVPSVEMAFKRYLGAGKPCDIKALWPSMEQVVQWITAGGGIAVLAHPLHYKITATKLRALLTDFKAAGGRAMEVISGSQPKHRIDDMAALAERFELLASVGSDFHRPDSAWSELGKIGKLPARCQPVWHEW